jgi:transposase-like protein
MKRRRWDAKAKARIVLEGLQGKSVSALYTEHQINQSQYDQWRDPCLANALKAFEVHQDAQKKARLARETTRFKTLVGELTLELTKSDDCLG